MTADEANEARLVAESERDLAIESRDAARREFRHVANVVVDALHGSRVPPEEMARNVVEVAVKTRQDLERSQRELALLRRTLAAHFPEFGVNDGIESLHHAIETDIRERRALVIQICADAVRGTPVVHFNEDGTGGRAPNVIATLDAAVERVRDLAETRPHPAIDA